MIITLFTRALIILMETTSALLWLGSRYSVSSSLKMISAPLSCLKHFSIVAQVYALPLEELSPINRSLNNDVDLSLHWALWARRWFSRFIKETPKVSSIDELLDLVF